jgi:hypothetical protein
MQFVKLFVRNIKSVDMAQRPVSGDVWTNPETFLGSAAGGISVR